MLLSTLFISILILAAVALNQAFVLNFQHSPTTAFSRIVQSHRDSSSLSLHAVMSPPPAILGIPLLGRFRKKRPVDQTKTIAVGDDLPDIEVEVLRSATNDDADDDDATATKKVITTATSIREVLGNGTAVLVGMPGAFTPTCSKQHLPGYIELAPKLATLGIEKIAVITTNDRFVNEEWSAQFGLLSAGSISSGGDGTLSLSTSSQDTSVVTVLCDGDGDLVRSMGLADDMGFGVGIRSKRFAMVTENGIVTTLLTDEGMEDCSKTSAESLIRVLDPNAFAVETPDGGPVDNKVIGGAVAVVALLVALASSLSLGGSGENYGNRLSPLSSPPPVVKSQPAKTPMGGKSSFSLLNEYL